ncbi:MAG: transcription-repair coupling factor [Chloroflexota bacterium]|nr:transcription-repair coupling factor [Chloroflexota bacterium]
MNLKQLLPLIEGTAEYRGLAQALGRGGGRSVVVMDAAKPYALAALHRQLKMPMLIVAAKPERARWLQDQLRCWGAEAALFPEPDSLPYEQMPSPYTVSQRVRALHSLSVDRSALVVTSAHALARITLSPEKFHDEVHAIKQGMSVDLEGTLAAWVGMGYQNEHMVEAPGGFSRRGGIIDVYSPAHPMPARIELFGDEVESIRFFDPATQRSIETVDEITIVPAREMSFDDFVAERDAGAIVDYLPAKSILVLDQPDDVERSIVEFDEESRQIRDDQTARGDIAADFPTTYFNRDELSARFDKIDRRLDLLSWRSDDEQEALSFVAAPIYGGRLEEFLDGVAQMTRVEQKRVVVISHQARRLTDLFEEKDIIAPVLVNLDKLPSEKSVALLQGSLARGWALGSTIVLTDTEIFGFTKTRGREKRGHPRRLGALSELVIGDHVVHMEHGIGIFAGMRTMAVGEREKEYLVLEYASGDKLYVPSDQIDRLGRYIGEGEEPPALSRLGSQEWARTRRKVKQAAALLARELLSIYAEREVVTGFAFSPDMVWQGEMEASFPYEETSDQLKAVVAIKQDMEQPKPMDRLVCGDVGYGKTEVALRAAFKAVMDGRQAAVLVPTTVLAQQHFETFSERLRAFPINVAVLSRFLSPGEQSKVVAKLRMGGIDVVIGTHRLLQKDVAFKNLGLLVIDEEQRFGVAHKEYLKKLRRDVDVLTLTATPIPRTLYMSLSGVRDMSTMETPPEERLPIKTYVGVYDEKIVRDAILREMDRGGQVFVVHNRIDGIHRIAGEIGKLVPHAVVTAAHGQMSPDQLENIMFDFYEGHIDVLVSTTIIEAGLDVPNANTLVVSDADRMGLAQLYQLRGRVGRSANRAYAYFLYDTAKPLTPQSSRRLETIAEATELGAGFRIAMRDLEIRGAGNILGSEQSGQIGAVGFDLYCRMLSDAVEELRTGKIKPDIVQQGPSIDLPVKARIPESYVSDLDVRLEIYQRISRITSREEVEAMRGELIDRFGQLPPQVVNLLYAVDIKVLAMEAGVESIVSEDRQLTLKLPPDKKFDKVKVQTILGNGVKVGTTQLRLDLAKLGNHWRAILEGVLRYFCEV